MTTTNFSSVKDSGSRESMPTGSVRDSREGKGRFDLLSPIVLERDAKHMENGAVKYGDRNWEKGQPISRFYDSAMRHMNKFLSGANDEDHLAAARWNIAGIIHTMELVKCGELPKELLDLPKWNSGIQNPRTRYFIKADGTFQNRYWRTSEDYPIEVRYIDRGKSAVGSIQSPMTLSDPHVFKEVPHAPF